MQRNTSHTAEVWRNKVTLLMTSAKCMMSTESSYWRLFTESLGDTLNRGTMQRIYRVWPRTVQHVRDCLDTAHLKTRAHNVTVSKMHPDGRIRVHVELADKYKIIPPDELKDRITACLGMDTGDRVIERRVRSRDCHISLDFILDGSQWNGLGNSKR